MKTMNFNEEEINILGQDLINLISNPLPKIAQDHIRMDLPFPVEELLQLESIDPVQKIKIRMAESAISMFLKYPTLHSIGIYKFSEHYHASISQIVWDAPDAILNSEE